MHSLQPSTSRSATCGGRLIWGRQSVEHRPGTRQRVLRTLPREQWHVQERPELRIVSDELWAKVQARREDERRGLGITSARPLARGRNASLYSRHLFAGFLRCAMCGRRISIVTGGYGSPRYGWPTAWASGMAICTNRLTVRAKVLDPLLLEGLRTELLNPQTVQRLTDSLAAELNQVMDQRPALRERAEAALADAERRLPNLVVAVESGTGTPSLLEAIKAREADVVRLKNELETMAEPIDQKLAIMPNWVRRQLEDVAGLLSESPQRTKTEFRRLGIEFVMHPQTNQAGRGYYRAEGTTSISHVLSGAQGTDFTGTGVTNLQSRP